MTNFFRDPVAWEQLKTEVLPALLSSHAPGQTLRAWVPGCASGEEAYSLAILFKELHEQLKLPKNSSLQIFATDLDHDAISKARQGHYPPNIVADFHRTPAADSLSRPSTATGSPRKSARW